VDTTIIGVKEAARILGVGENRCKELAQQGIIPAMRVGKGKWMFNAELLQEAIKLRMLLEASERRKVALAIPSHPEHKMNPFRAKIGRPRREPPALPEWA